LHHIWSCDSETIDDFLLNPSQIQFRVDCWASTVNYDELLTRPKSISDLSHPLLSVLTHGMTAKFDDNHVA
jgi:hypothetical protein